MKSFEAFEGSNTFPRVGYKTEDEFRLITFGMHLMMMTDRAVKIICFLTRMIFNRWGVGGPAGDLNTNNNELL